MGFKTFFQTLEPTQNFRGKNTKENQ